MTFTEYGKAQITAASKVDQICKRVKIDKKAGSRFSVESGELVPMFVPGPFSISHHLISSWPHQVDFCKSVVKVKCSCKHYEAYGLLCQHIFYVLRINSIKELPQKYLNNRWPKNAKPFNTAEPLQPSKKIKKIIQPKNWS